MAENKQQRMLIWTRQEIWALPEGVEKYANYVVGKRFGPGVTAQTRQEDWSAIADMVNATGGQNRAVAKSRKKVDRFEIEKCDYSVPVSERVWEDR